MKDPNALLHELFWLRIDKKNIYSSAGSQTNYHTIWSLADSINIQNRVFLSEEPLGMVCGALNGVWVAWEFHESTFIYFIDHSRAVCIADWL